ncbi:MAG: AMP-binding protein [Caulobacteraceae bacterium]|nr:AMP-binding protein [Caulobacteraceae bacterium]
MNDARLKAGARSIMRVPVNRYQEAILRHFEERPDAVFCHLIGDDGETILTWRDLAADCGRFSAAYRRAGLTAGDQALIFLRHTPHLYGAFLGAMLAGITPAFMPCSSPRQDPALYWSSHQALLTKIRPAAIVTDRATLAEMRDSGLGLEHSRIVLVEDTAPAPPSRTAMGEEAIALLQHSSGTTGLKKGVALTFAAIVEQIESYAAAIALTSEDSIVSWLPLYHDMGLIACLILPAYFAIPVAHLDPFHWIGRPGMLFDHLAKRKSALTWLPNFAFEHLTATAGRRAASWDLSGVRAFINCSEPCRAATFDRFADAFAPAGVRPEQLQCCYAMAETVFAVSQTRLGRAPPARIHVDPASLDRGLTPRSASPGEGLALIETGRVIDGLALSVHDENGAPIAEQRIGEIGLSGNFLFRGYNRDAEHTARRLRDGVYFTGDLGFVRDGRLYILGRIDDLIIVNGRNLYAHEVEAVVGAVSGVKPGRTVALGLVDERVGSEALVIMAERARSAGRTDEDVRRDVVSAVHSVFNVTPRSVELIDEGRLVKTSSGKVSRSENRARSVAARAAVRSQP